MIYSLKQEEIVSLSTFDRRMQGWLFVTDDQIQQKCLRIGQTIRILITN